MSNPYDNNPFAVDTGNIKNEFDANRALVDAAKHLIRIRRGIAEANEHDADDRGDNGSGWYNMGVKHGCDNALAILDALVTD